MSLPILGVGAAGGMDAGTVAGAARALAGDPRSVQKASVQFEAMLIQEMMKSGRGGGGGWLGDEDEAGSVLAEMAEQQFAQLIAANGGLGIAKLVTQGLDAKAGPAGAEVSAEVKDANRTAVTGAGPG